MRSLIKAAARQIVPSKILGAIDFLRFPSRRTAWGGPFNGQPARQALFREMVAKLHPYALVETGTYLGTTTEFMAQTGLPVYTIEANPRSFGFVRVRFWRTYNITLICGDSRTALRKLLRDDLSSHTLFFYLDAHWNDDLPLAEEIDIVFGRCPMAVVMIDDFQVPSDPGYDYDDYGAGKALIPSYVASPIAAYNLQAFYPVTPSAEESGLRRGCIVLARQAAAEQALSSLALLRPAAEAELASPEH
jgi:predicted O-methyltransferase YrrM